VISPAHAEEFTRGLGETVAGSWRLINLARQMGVPQALGLTLEEWVDERLGGYVRLSDAEFHTAVLELRKEGLSQRQIAQVTGFTQTDISREERGVRVRAESDDSPRLGPPNQEAEFATSNGNSESNDSQCDHLSLVEAPPVSAAEAAIRQLLRRFTREELLAALEAVA
jgi:transcriptional regulator with XRE-family HTH domain